MTVTTIKPDDQILPTEFTETEAQKSVLRQYINARIGPDFSHITTNSEMQDKLDNYAKSLCVELHKLTGDVWLNSEDYFISRGFSLDPDRLGNPNACSIYRVKDGVAFFTRIESYSGQKLKLSVSPLYRALPADPILTESGKAYATGSNVVDMYKALPYDYEYCSIGTGKPNTIRIAKRIEKDMLTDATNTLKSCIERHNSQNQAANNQATILKLVSDRFSLRPHYNYSLANGRNSDYEQKIAIRVNGTGKKIDVELSDLSIEKATALSEWIKSYDSQAL